MKAILFYSLGNSPACRWATDFLNRSGISFVGHISPEITHLLLDVPSFSPDGNLRFGGDLAEFLRMLPQNITIIGGNLQHPALEGYRTLDLLRDESYLAENAAITAHCALQIAAPLLTGTLADSPALVLGWGRIGKCLVRLLRALDCDVTVAARKERDRAMLEGLGYRAVDFGAALDGYRLIFNTVPELVIPEDKVSLCKNAVKIDLASRRGIAGEDVVWARGLPGIHAPESSGRLISGTVLRLLKEEAT